jgi:hypothetical protein
VRKSLTYQPSVPIFLILILAARLIRLDNGIRYYDRIEEVLGQVGRQAVLLQRTSTGNDCGFIVEEADSNVIARDRKQCSDKAGLEHVVSAAGGGTKPLNEGQPNG